MILHADGLEFLLGQAVPIFLSYGLVGLDDRLDLRIVLRRRQCRASLGRSEKDVRDAGRGGVQFVLGGIFRRHAIGIEALGAPEQVQDNVPFRGQVHLGLRAAVGGRRQQQLVTHAGGAVFPEVAAGELGGAVEIPGRGQGVGLDEADDARVDFLDQFPVLPVLRRAGLQVIERLGRC